MKNIIILVLCFVTGLFILSCSRKCEEEVTNISPPCEVPIWSQGDTTNGAAIATKICKEWKASGYAGVVIVQPYPYKIGYIRYNTHENELKEVMQIAFPYKVGKYKVFKYDSDYTNERAGGLYNTRVLEDVIDDGYYIDEEKNDNYIEVTKIDTTLKLIEGRFNLSFLKDTTTGTTLNPQNPYRVNFSNGCFKAKIVR